MSKIFTMQETCILCGKKQETNDVFYRYEDSGFSLCKDCDDLGNEEINKRWKLKNEMRSL